MRSIRCLGPCLLASCVIGPVEKIAIAVVSLNDAAVFVANALHHALRSGDVEASCLADGHPAHVNAGLFPPGYDRPDQVAGLKAMDAPAARHHHRGARGATTLAAAPLRVVDPAISPSGELTDPSGGNTHQRSNTSSNTAWSTTDLHSAGRNIGLRRERSCSPAGTLAARCCTTCAASIASLGPTGNCASRSISSRR